MKGFCLSLLLLLFIAPTSAQTQNEINYSERLYHVCKIWGYVQFFHPNIQQCKVEWEEILLDYLPLFKDANDPVVFNELLCEMVKEAGLIPSPLASYHTTDINKSSNWINNRLYSPSLIHLLSQIRDQHQSAKHCLIDTKTEIGNPIFNFKYPDDNSALPELEYRLLALFQYWNVIHYFYPYKELMDQDWDTTLQHFIPPFINAKTEIEYHLAFKAISGQLNDAHAFLQSDVYDQYKGQYFPPFSARYIEQKVVITKVLEDESSLKVGDVIEMIDGYTMEYLRDSLSSYIHASNIISFERNFIDHILYNKEGTFDIVVQNSAGRSQHTLFRNSANYQLLHEVKNTNAYYRKKVGNCQFVYVNMGSLENNMINHLFEELRDVDVLIFDARQYPKATLWSIANYLFDRPIHVANILIPDIKQPGTFYWKAEKIGQNSPQLFKGKLVLLMDERTQSQGEYTVMSLEKYHNTITIGSQTAGTNGDVSYIDLPGGIRSYFSGLGTYHTDYTATQRTGILPDIDLAPTIAGIRNGRDEVLDLAFNYNYQLSPDLCPSEKEVKLYPNPFRNQLNVEIKSPTTETYDVEIVDLMGKIIRSFQITSNGSYDEQLNNLNAGIYIIKLSGKDWSMTKKVIKN